MVVELRVHADVPHSGREKVRVWAVWHAAGRTGQPPCAGAEMDRAVGCKEHSRRQSEAGEHACGRVGVNKSNSRASQTSTQSMEADHMDQPPP